MSTKREPLLSDEQLSGVVIFPNGAKRYETEMGADEVRNIYEAARAKDAELIQHLVNELVMLQYVFASETGYETRWGDDALAAAAAAGFTPTDQ